MADPTRRAILDELSERDDQTLFELCSRLAARGSPTAGRSGAWIQPGEEPAAMGPVTTAVLDDTCGNLIQIAAQNTTS